MNKIAGWQSLLPFKISRQHHQVGVLYSCTLLNILLGVVISMLNTRALSPKFYGDVKFVVNITAFAVGLLTLGYFVSGCRLLALNHDPIRIRRLKGVMLLLLGLAMATVMLVLTGIGCWYWWSGKRELGCLFMVGALVSSAPLLRNYINTVAQGDNKIGGMALSRLLPSLLYVIVGGTVYHFWGATPSRMLLLQYGMIAAVILVIIFHGRPLFSGLKEEFADLNRENRQYGFQVYLGSVCGVSLGHLAGITLGIFSTDNVEVGLFSLGAALAAPLLLLPSIVGTVYYKRFATSESIDWKIIVATTGLALLSLVGFLVMIFPVVRLLYPPAYSAVAGYACWLSAAMIIHGMGDMFNRFLGAHGKGKALRNGAWLCGIVLLMGNIFGVYWLGIEGAIATRVLASVSYLLAMLWYYRRYVSRPCEEKEV